MAEVTPFPASSVIIVRDAPFEVLMILRHEQSSFVPNTWVFPGGAVDAEDGEPGTLEAMKAAAVREAFEETAIRLDGELVWTSRWITPAGLPKRFDTWFFLAAVPRDVPVTLQEEEAVDHLWISPAAALRRHAEGDFPMVFPTIKNLEAIADAKSAAELIESRRGVDIRPVKPVMIVEGGRRRIVVP
jgi:8-oxo-dGTP pyrophosphatase MutT (NUDIX family)